MKLSIPVLDRSTHFTQRAFPRFADILELPCTVESEDQMSTREGDNVNLLVLAEDAVHHKVLDGDILLPLTAVDVLDDPDLVADLQLLI